MSSLTVLYLSGVGTDIGILLTMPRSAADNPTLYNTGGYIKVNGLRITIPLNLQFQFPAAFIPFKDVAGRFTGYEVSVRCTDREPLSDYTLTST